MQHPIRNFLTSLSLLLFFVVTGCDDEDKQLKVEYDKHTFDQQVIDKLPLYDSLVAAIIRNSPSFQKFIRDDDNHRSFRYLPDSEYPDDFIKLPPAAVPGVEPYYTRIGKDHIYGFEIFKDSSIKIFVRTKFIKESIVEVTEILSYYPYGKFRNRVFPEKDTVLNKNWQYWARIDKDDPF